MSKGIGQNLVFPETAISGTHGLNLLEYFTCAAMQGLLANSERAMEPSILAKEAVRCAQATLAELAIANAS